MRSADTRCEVSASAAAGARLRQGQRTTENLAQAKSPFRPSSSRESSIRRGSSGAPPTQRDRRELNDYLVQQSGVGELTGQVSAADDPDVSVARCAGHRFVHLRDLGAGELDLRVGHTGSCRWVKTQHGTSYGHSQSVGSLPANSWATIHS